MSRPRTAELIVLVNGAFLKAGGTPDQFRVGIARAIELSWLTRHESGTYVKLRKSQAK